MITQIYALQTLEDALGVIDAGADYIGFLPPQHRKDGIVMPDEISEEETFRILEGTKGKATRVILSVNDDPEFYIQMALKYQPDVVHVSSRTFRTNASFYRDFKAAVPHVRLLQAVPVQDASAVDFAKEVAPYADILILDSVSSGVVNGVGASGNVHDRDIDKAIIEAVDIPVIIAGGLDENNVAQAIEATNPWGVDSMTRTNIFENGKNTLRKDMKKVELFCAIAKNY